MRARIASYNVQDLFLCGENEPAKSATSLNYLCRSLNRLAADVLCLQEVGSIASLNLLNSKLKAPYPYAYCLLGNSARSICLGFLSRWPLDLQSFATQVLQDAAGEPLRDFASQADAAQGRLDTLKMQRDLVLAQVMLTDEFVLQIVHVHLKSPVTRDWMVCSAAMVREAEVRQVAALLTAHQSSGADCRLLVGDLNGLIANDEFLPLHELGLEDPIGERLRAQGRNPATYWPKRRARIDHILVVPTLSPLSVDSAESNYQVTDATIHVHHEAKKASDHYPISLDISYVG